MQPEKTRTRRNGAQQNSPFYYAIITTASDKAVDYIASRKESIVMCAETHVMGLDGTHLQ